MAKTIVGLYDQFATAQQVVQVLVEAGYEREHISLVANDATGEHGSQITTPADLGDGPGVGAGIGAMLGGLGGFLVGLGALAIPGIGPVIAAGPLIPALTGAGLGAVAGGFVGALVDMGLPEEAAQYYAEGVRRGGTLVTATVADERADRAVVIMENYNPVDIEQRASQWQQTGWTAFDATAVPYTQAEVNRDRELYGVQTGDDTVASETDTDVAIPDELARRRIRSYMREKSASG